MHSKNGPGIAVADVNGDQLEDFYIGGASGQQGALFIQQPNHSFKTLPQGDLMQEAMGSLFFDADNDGDQDLYSVGGELLLKRMNCTPITFMKMMAKGFFQK